MTGSVAAAARARVSDKGARTAGPVRTPTVMMCRLLFALVLATTALRAQAADPLHSHECAVARDVLERALDDASARGESASERLALARRQAVAACLGRERGTAKRSGAPEPAVAVPPPAIAPEPAPAQRAAAAPPSAPLAIPRPATVTACDPGGCWDSEGRRLNSIGPLLVGPHGACSLQGGVVQCP